MVRVGGESEHTEDQTSKIILQRLQVKPSTLHETTNIVSSRIFLL